MTPASCRFCRHPLTRSFADLGMSPLANSYVSPEHLQAMEPFYPLHAYVCEQCLLVQLEEFEPPERIFADYAYFSSCSESWLQHAQAYSEQMIERFGIDTSWQVIEVASNDGYLLRNFKSRGIPVLGIEPAANVARAAADAGIPTEVRFFGRETARALVDSGRQADLLIGNNVLAHVPDLNDFVAGLRRTLKERGILTMEFPHLLRLIEHNEFDTIYHEHFSYFSLLTVEKVFRAHGLALFDVEQLSTHGGSLRIFAQRADEGSRAPTARLAALREEEERAGLTDLRTYDAFAEKVRETKRKLLTFLIGARREGKRIVGYGAPAKGNTLLNYCGVRGDFLDYVVDVSPHKQGRYLPGTRLPIHSPERIFETRPDYVLILPWNLKDEIVRQMEGIRAWGAQFVVPIPEVTVH